MTRRRSRAGRRVPGDAIGAGVPPALSPPRVRGLRAAAPAHRGRLGARGGLPAGRVAPRHRRPGSLRLALLAPDLDPRHRDQLLARRMARRPARPAPPGRGHRTRSSRGRLAARRDRARARHRRACPTDTGRCWCCTTSKDSPTKKSPRRWASCPAPRRASWPAPARWYEGVSHDGRSGTRSRRATGRRAVATARRRSSRLPASRTGW